MLDVKVSAVRFYIFLTLLTQILVRRSLKIEIMPVLLAEWYVDSTTILIHATRCQGISYHLQRLRSPSRRKHVASSILSPLGHAAKQQLNSDLQIC